MSGILVGLLVLQGCKSGGSMPGGETAAPAVAPLAAPVSSAAAGAPAAPDSGDQVIATIRGDSITRNEIDPVLIDGYGLNVLLTLVQRDLVHQEAARMKVVVTAQDIADEQNLTLRALKKAAERVDPVTGATSQPDSPDDITPEEATALLNRVLEQSHVSKAEFNVVVEINAYLRKIAEPQVQAQLTDEQIRKHFNAMYGEKVLVHYIVVDTMVDAAQVRRDLSMGNTFEDVAKNRSKDWRTAAAGGELPPFTLQDNRFPDEFKQVAFLLKKGEVSDPLQVGKFIYIVKLIDRIAPEHARFEDYRDTARKDLYEQAIQAAITAMRQSLGKMALTSMHIINPVLNAQWEQRLAAKSGEVHDMNSIRHEMDQQRNGGTTGTTMPSTQASSPFDSGTTQPIMPEMDHSSTQAGVSAATEPSAGPPATATMPATGPGAQ
ncbi:MAG: peptidyl-prolyl cis-trans isomerase [Planctomycetota bacterium]|nr:peptidyl-prolyl cis-trans isomerase [Planctomycetota bacterium]